MIKIDEIKVKIENEKEDLITISVVEPQPTSIEIGVEPVPSQLIHLDIRRTLDNNYIVYDHPLFDIVVNPDKKKIMTFVKKFAKTEAYPHQDAFFNYLKTRGVILPDTIKGGNIFGSLEATYPANKKIDVVKVVLLNIFMYLREELPKLKKALDYDFEVDNMMVDPTPEDSTEYGEVPQRKKKGTMDPFYTQYYGLLYRI
jgi:hypothetical protein